MKGIEEAVLKQIRDLVEAEFGIACPDSQFPVFEKKMAQVLIDVSEKHKIDVAVVARSDPGRLLSLILPKVTVGETFFFRNRAQFEALRQRILPALLRELGGNAPLIIWSAGCSSGEEPYSLAMWIAEYAPEIFPGRVKIIATDVNPQSIEKAKAGRFSRRSFRQNDAYWIRKYFSQKKEEFVLDESVRAAVSFQAHNLACGALPLGIPPREASLVFCRNVLIYFTSERASKILTLFQDALSKDGFLMLGHAESFAVLNQWRRNYLPGTFFYQKPIPGAVNRPKRISVVTPPRSGGRSDPTPPRVESSRTALAPSRRSLAAAPAQQKKPVPDDELVRIQKYLETGALKECMERLTQFLRREKTSVDAYFLLALCADQLGDLERAQAAMKNALFLNKGLVMGHYFLGTLSERQGDNEGAIRSYQTVCRLLTNHDDGELVPHGDWLTVGYLREIAKARTLELQTRELDADMEGEHGSAPQPP